MKLYELTDQYDKEFYSQVEVVICQVAAHELNPRGAAEGILALAEEWLDNKKKRFWAEAEDQHE